MMNFEELQALAATDKIKEMRSHLDRLDIENKTRFIKGFDQDKIAALNLYKTTGGFSHFDGWLFMVSQFENKYGHFLKYLQALEVPHFNIYDLVISGKDLRIIDTLTESGCQLFNEIPKAHPYYERIFDYVASKTSDIDRLDLNGCTALHLSVIHQGLKMFQILSQHGANPFVIHSGTGSTCDQIAERNHHGALDNDFYRNYIALRNRMDLAKQTVKPVRKVSL